MLALGVALRVHFDEEAGEKVQFAVEGVGGRGARRVEEVKGFDCEEAAAMFRPNCFEIVDDNAEPRHARWNYLFNLLEAFKALVARYHPSWVHQLLLAVEEAEDGRGVVASAEGVNEEFE